MPGSACTAAPKRWSVPARWDCWGRRPAAARAIDHSIRAMRAHPPARDTQLMNQTVKPVRYEIRVRGLLGETLLGAFPDLGAKQLLDVVQLFDDFWLEVLTTARESGN